MADPPGLLARIATRERPPRRPCQHQPPGRQEDLRRTDRRRRADRLPRTRDDPDRPLTPAVEFHRGVGRGRGDQGPHGCIRWRLTTSSQATPARLTNAVRPARCIRWRLTTSSQATSEPAPCPGPPGPPGSPGSLIVSFAGSYLREIGGWIAVADLIKCLQAVELTAPSVRQALVRLKSRGFLAAERRSGEAGYLLTRAGVDD